jgi:bis(5'-nucleosyl)-tetraphosphatase (symmetrical)
VAFGHWAKRGLIDLPRFKGLDTGCVYGRKLTGWCPEENRFYQVPARRAYAAINKT